MIEQGDSLFSHLSDTFLRGDYQKANAERQKIEALIQQRALSQNQFVQFNRLISRYQRVKGALAEAQNTADPYTALGILANVLELEPKFLPALFAKVARLLEAAHGAIGPPDASQGMVLLDRAAVACGNVIKLHRTAPYGHLTRGYILLERCDFSRLIFGNVDTGSLKQAADDTSEAIELLLDQGYPASEIAAAWKQLGRIYVLRHDVLESSLRGSEAPEVELDRIARMRDLARDHAIAAFTRAIELDGSDWQAYTECGKLLEWVRLSDSIPYLVEAVRIAPDKLEARLALINGLTHAVRAGIYDNDVYLNVMDHCLYILNVMPADSGAVNVLSETFEQILGYDPHNQRALRALNELLDRWLPLVGIDPADQDARTLLVAVLPHILLHYPSHPKALEALNRLPDFDRQNVQDSYAKMWRRANRPH